MILAFSIITSIVTPPFIWLIMLWKILPKAGRTLAQERKDLIKCTILHGGTYLWIAWTIFWGYVIIKVGF